MNNNLYTTRNEAIDREIIGPIEDGANIEDAYADYDVDAIADEVLEWVDGYDADKNMYNLNKQGYRLAEDIDHDDFWDSVMRNAK